MGRSLATLSFFVLFFFSSQVEVAHTPNLDSSAVAVLDVQNNPVLPPVLEQTNSLRGASFFSPERRKYLSDILQMPLNLPAFASISWSHKIKTFVAMPIIQENCLATAVYFEARSESKLGQLAVATVVLNRLQASNSSSSICGVVYKGASHFNGCQFSFACDGKPDLVTDARAWLTAVEIADLALKGEWKSMGGPMQVLAVTATNYHADYVNPRWSKSLSRLTKIGRHIFYSQNSAGGTMAGRTNYI